MERKALVTEFNRRGAPMTYYVIKVVLSAVLIVAVSEIAKRSSFLGGLVASLPIISLLAFVWLYVDTKSLDKVAGLSTSIFWLVLPSLSLFVALPLFLKKTGNFYLGLGAAIATMLACYVVMVFVLKRFEVEL
jgi:ABC-type xylose transport system permease subunit